MVAESVQIPECTRGPGPFYDSPVELLEPWVKLDAPQLYDNRSIGTSSVARRKQCLYAKATPVPSVARFPAMKKLRRDMLRHVVI